MEQKFCFEKDFCFVVMPFNKDFQQVYDFGIKPAVKASEPGLQCIRGDEIKDGGGNILRSIVKYIHKAKVLIVDLTGINSNVYYELGLAHALDAKVIMIAEESQKLPFDLVTYRVIYYNTNWGGAEALKESIIQSINAMDNWGEEPTNPVTDFLSEKDRPVPAGEHRRLKADLQEAQQDLADVRSRMERYETQIRNLREIQAEKARLEGKLEALEELIAKAGGEGMTLDKILKKSEASIDEDGDVTISIPSSQDPGGKVIPMKKRRIIFRKMEDQDQ